MEVFNFMNLVLEMRIHIACFLKDKEILNLLSTCKRNFQMIKNDLFWQILLERKHLILPNKRFRSYKNEYMAKWNSNFEKEPGFSSISKDGLEISVKKNLKAFAPPKVHGK